MILPVGEAYRTAITVCGIFAYVATSEVSKYGIYYVLKILKRHTLLYVAFLGEKLLTAFQQENLRIFKTPP